jgi:hypothetical protein
VEKVNGELRDASELQEIDEEEEETEGAEQEA